ncbi:unnamed protein product [Adineta ricciae]|uniref:Uncharacterized protein n=1 Tax=Adineta ricciae TaxID=249248 RepID=A0A814DNV6_ADIRI|nr:unnamed protein product [Adineta ricciae]
MGNRQTHERRHSSYASFVVTSSSTNPNEELENYICAVNESNDGSSTPSVRLEFESFISPIVNNSRLHSISSPNNEQLIVYAAPVIQMQLSSRCKETIERLKEIKKEKSILLAIINPPIPKTPARQYDDQQQSEKKLLNQMSDLMKRKHQLRLIELEESVLLAQQDLLKSPSPSMNTAVDNEPETQKRNGNNSKGLWRDAFRALKTSTVTSATSATANENRPQKFYYYFSTLSIQRSSAVLLKRKNRRVVRQRSHSLGTEHSKAAYLQHRTIAETSRLSIPGSDSQFERSTKSSSSWFQQRFTWFAADPSPTTSSPRQITATRSSIYNDESYSALLGRKRSSVIGHMMESFVRRLSSRKKKSSVDREREREKEEEKPVTIDPVYETLRIAAETRKRTLANYLQQRQQTLNKQTSLNSQGSSEVDTQPSPRVVRHSDQMSSSQTPTTTTTVTTSSLSSGKSN